MRSRPRLGVQLALGWLGLVVGCAVFADLLWFLKEPNYLYGFWEGAPRSAGPSREFWLGTDASSRDNLARLVYGARISLIIATLSVTCAFVVGVTLGSIAGFFRGRTEAVIMAALDVVLAFPPLVLAVLAITIFREARHLLVLAMLLALAFVPSFARLARANALTLRTRAHVDAARSIGTRETRILWREVVPQLMAPLGAYALSAAAVVMALENSLAFIGFGQTSRLPSWGRMILLARVDIRVTIWPLVYPSVVLVATILSINVVADWLRERSRSRSTAASSLDWSDRGRR